jgi:hypothetical protein
VNAAEFSAESWALTDDVVEVVPHHHPPENASHNKALVALVGLSNLSCRMGAIGHGFPEMRQVNFLDEPGFAILRDECPSSSEFDGHDSRLSLKDTWRKFAVWSGSYIDHREARRPHFERKVLSTVLYFGLVNSV